MQLEVIFRTAIEACKKNFQMKCDKGNGWEFSLYLITFFYSVSLLQTSTLPERLPPSLKSGGRFSLQIENRLKYCFEGIKWFTYLFSRNCFSKIHLMK